jgi:hypothetical protein
MARGSDQELTSGSGQATVEALAAVILLVFAGAVALQLLVTGYALALADGAAEAGALALAAGGSAKESARQALPAWAEEDIEVSVRGGEVTVRLRPPGPLAALTERLSTASSAFARPVGRGRWGDGR